MSFLKNLFSGGNKPPENLKFGRYTDSNKSKKQLDAWDKSVKLFDEKKYLESYHHFFEYLGDESLQNVTFAKQNGTINFDIVQGSKVIKGTVTNEKVIAETVVASFEKPSIAFMRKLMELNYALKYARFALKDNNICMKFTSHTLDGSPTKIYWSLRELCTFADKQDDILTAEFSSLQSVGTQHVFELEAELKEKKYAFFTRWINDTFKKADAFDEDKFAGAISYLYLALLYRIDYLLSPEGVMMHKIEKINGIYFAKDNLTTAQRNQSIRKELNELLALPKDEFLKSMYAVKQTFGVTPATNHKTVADFIFDESGKTNWYRDNNYPDTVITIYEYISGYCLFNYGMYQPCIELFHLYMQLLHADFFEEMGIKPRYISQSMIPDKHKIEDTLRDIVKRAKETYPYFEFNVSYLKYDNISVFSTTFFKEFDYLNFNKA